MHQWHCFWARIEDRLHLYVLVETPQGGKGGSAEGKVRGREGGNGWPALLSDHPILNVTALTTDTSPCNGPILDCPFSPPSQIPTRGRSRGGRCANLSQIAHQTCAKLLVLPFVHHTKGAQNCHKSVANSKVNFGQIYANTPFPMPPSRALWPSLSCWCPDYG